MSVSGAQYQLQIQALRQEKSQTEDEIRGLADRSSEWQLKVYRLMLVINAEIANKHFKETNSDLFLPNRIISAVALMVSSTPLLKSARMNHTRFTATFTLRKMK